MSSVPERVLSLIEVSGLTRGEFGRRIGLDESKMSKSLNGTRRFSAVDLARIADLCQVTVDWLITGEEPPLTVAARTTGGNARIALAAAKRYSRLRTDMADMGYQLQWSPTDLKLGQGSYTEQGRSLAREALVRVHEAHRSVVGNLVTLLEEVFAVDVAVVELGTGFDGLAVSSEHVKLIVLATSNLSDRQRFTLAHELGHLLAGDDHGIHLDEDVYDKAQSKDPSEVRANAFASAFLMPEEILRAAASPTGLTEQGFATLSCDLMVSPTALAYRLRDLRLIDSGGCDRYRAISSANAAAIASRGEELAHRIAEARTPRPPRLLVRDTYAAYEAGLATLRPYANLLGVDVDELRQALESRHGNA